MAESDSDSVDRAIGLCLHCSHKRQVETKRGSVFYLCMLSERDFRFAKYPRLPVLRCSGFVRADVPRDAPTDEARRP